MKNFFILALITLLASCAIYPNKPEYQLSDEARIGVILAIKSKAKEYQFKHNLYSELKVSEHEVDWRLGETFLNALNKNEHLDKKFEFVDLSNEKINLFLLGEIKPTNKIWNIPSRTEDEALRVKEKYKLDGLIILTEEDISLGVICMPSGVCRNFDGVGYGLLKRGELIGSTYNAIAGFGLDLILFDPLVNLSYTHDYYRLNKKKIFHLNKFKKPKKGESYNSDHWAIVHRALNRHILELVRYVHLSTQGLPLPPLRTTKEETSYEDDY